MTPRLALLLLVAPLLASCGLAKPLNRPAPMWGAARDKYEADQARQKAEAAARAADKPAGPVKPVDVPPPPPPRPMISGSPLDAPTLPGN